MTALVHMLLAAWFQWRASSEDGEPSTPYLDY